MRKKCERFDEMRSDEKGREGKGREELEDKSSVSHVSALCTL